MQGSLALSRGTLFVGVHAKTAHVHAFDLGGRALGPSFSFRDARAGRSAVGGIALDDDRTVWIADTPADRVRQFSLFGREVGGFGAPPAGGAGPAPLLPGLVAAPVDVEVRGGRDRGWVAVACGGEQRHAVQLYEPDFTWRASLPSLGDPQRDFRGACRLAAQGDRLWVAESLARAVQVFREGEFLFAFHLDARGERLEPSGVAPLEDGRAVIACRAPQSALVLVDAAGRALGVLAQEGADEGSVLEPSDVVVEPGADDRRARVFVVDRDGLRVQAFTLDGRCLGLIPLSGATRAAARRRKKGGR